MRASPSNLYSRERCAQFFARREFCVCFALACYGWATAAKPSASKIDVPTPLTERERWLLDRVEQLEKRVADLEAKGSSPAVAPSEAAAAARLQGESAVPVGPANDSAGASVGAETDAIVVPANSLAIFSTKQDQSATGKPAKAEPFAFADFTWLNGNARTKGSPMDTKFFTPEIRADVDYNYSFNHPKDDTISGSSEVFRHGEVQVTQLGMGGDFHYDNVRARLTTQFGMYSQTTPRNDASPARGQWNLADAYRYGKSNQAYSKFFCSAIDVLDAARAGCMIQTNRVSRAPAHLRAVKTGRRVLIDSKRILRLFCAAALCISCRALADDKEAVRKDASSKETTKDALQDAQPQTAQDAPRSLWKYNGFLDFGYLLDFNHPANHLFRDRGTTFRVDELDVNMGGAGVKKDATQDSRWGTELEVQGGKDSLNFGFSATAPNVDGANVLRHFGAANISYLVPVSRGLTVQGGLFSSLIGYDSLYAKDNLEYTRPWGADYTPYLMFGVNASYPVSKKITVAGFVINDYFHLAHPNVVPGFGGQLSYSVGERLNFKETMLYGPHQADTSSQFWRFFSDSILEWKKEKVTTAFEYQIGTEKVSVPGTPRALWMSAQLPFHRAITERWSATVRPEFAWDRDGRWTGSKQTIKAFTSALEYRLPYWKTNTIARLEYRVDDSRGAGGGFFRGAQISPGIVALVPTQQLLAIGLIVTFESH